MTHCYFCIHGHFYQPPRIDPFTGRVPREPDAAPYTNWNTLISAECYTPMAEAGLFEHISFNLGGTLARWLDEHDHQTYRKIVDSEQAHREAHGVSNGLAQSVHHTILPLARRRDKICQIKWGIESFAHRFGYRPAGLWLPEMAVDYETLEIAAEEGCRFTILSDEQVRGDLSLGAGPYRVDLPNGGSIAVFVRDRHLSNSLSFQMPQPSEVERWLREQVEWRCQRDRLLLIATDGETFGHHHKQGIQVLERTIQLSQSYDYRVTTLGHYVQNGAPPDDEMPALEIVEHSAWSCGHGLSRWVVGCDCTPGDSRWKGALRRALDNLACDLDHAYVCAAERLQISSWPLRDDYIAVILGRMDGFTFLAEHGLAHLDHPQSRRLLALLEAQFYRQRMYASCTFFFEDLDRPEPRYAIANAIRALALTRYATGEDLCPGFDRDLKAAVSGNTGRTGSDLFESLLAKAEL